MAQMTEPAVLFGALSLHFEDGDRLESRGRCCDLVYSHQAVASAGAVLSPRVCLGMSGLSWILTMWGRVVTGI